jgi:hypothetical protein
LETAREANSHPGTKGDASENVWLDVLNTYLPNRYQAAKAHVIDSLGSQSDQIDILILDRQYSPLIFHDEGAMYAPAESIYAVFEAKQTINASLVQYAQNKVRSVRQLHRTSLPVPHVSGTADAKDPGRILGGILCLESEWSPAMGESLKKALNNEQGDGRLDFGCIASHGYFWTDPESNAYCFDSKNKAATAFIFRLITELQKMATVPMIDAQAYVQWLNK